MVVLLACGCSSFVHPMAGEQAVSFPKHARSAVAHRSSAYPIDHIVVLIQENRSFDNIFAGFPGADAPTYGYSHTGKRIKLKRTTFVGPDLQHGFVAALVDYNNANMNGFDLGNPSDPTAAYAFIDRKDVAPYWTMAKTYVLADHMFPTEFGGSFAAHLNLVAGTDQLSPTTAEADNPSNIPWGCDAPSGTTTALVNSNRQESTGPFPCFTQFTTMADSLDSAGVSWKFYAPQVVGCPQQCDPGFIWTVFDAISNVRYGSDWQRNVVYPETSVLSDIQNGNLPSVSWVIPDYKDSDHPSQQNNDRGPSWVAAVVNAIGQSPYWNSTAIVVVWDDWGGWYDDVAPPQLDFEGLAIRTPCLIISPYARAGYVSHTQYEPGSILKFTEEVFGLPSLNHTDARANPLDDSFDFTQNPLPFKKIPAKYPPPLFRHEQPSLIPPDDD